MKMHKKLKNDDNESINYTPWSKFDDKDNIDTKS